MKGLPTCNATAPTKNVRMVVVSPYTAAEFTESLQNKFIRAVAFTTSIDTSAVKIHSITEKEVEEEKDARSEERSTSTAELTANQNQERREWKNKQMRIKRRKRRRRRRRSILLKFDPTPSGRAQLLKKRACMSESAHVEIGNQQSQPPLTTHV